MAQDSRTHPLNVPFHNISQTQAGEGSHSTRMEGPFPRIKHGARLSVDDFYWQVVRVQNSNRRRAWLSSPKQGTYKQASGLGPLDCGHFGPCILLRTSSQAGGLLMTWGKEATPWKGHEMYVSHPSPLGSCPPHTLTAQVRGARGLGQIYPSPGSCLMPCFPFSQ